MNVKITKTGEVVAVNDSYGARLIEQGQAVHAVAEKVPKATRKNAAVKSEEDV